MKTKNKVLIGVVAIATVAVAVVNVHFANKSESSLSALHMANVEALAQGESGGSSGTFTCYSTYNNCWFWDCSTIYRCGNPCETARADAWSDQGTCSN